MFHRIRSTTFPERKPVVLPLRRSPATADKIGDLIIMESVNFEFLRKRPDWQPLADLAGFAERYARPDPVAAAGQTAQLRRASWSTGSTTP